MLSIFSVKGGEKIAASYDTTMLGSLPLALDIRQQADAGNPTVAADPQSSAALLYREMARKIAAGLVERQAGDVQIPSITISDD